MSCARLLAVPGTGERANPAGLGRRLRGVLRRLRVVAVVVVEGAHVLSPWQSLLDCLRRDFCELARMIPYAPNLSYPAGYVKYEKMWLWIVQRKNL